MSLTRRAFLGAAVAGTTFAAGGAPFPAEARPLPEAVGADGFSPIGDVIGKVSVGYQGWYGCAGDGQQLGWWHNANNWGQPPSPTNEALSAWPDLRDYEKSYQTQYANLNNGQPATLYSNSDYQTVDTHFRWMQEAGIDTAALQRFNPTGGEGPPRDLVTSHVRTAAEKYGRKFYLMYDIGDWANMQAEAKYDWVTKMSAYTASSAYARQNGKPVVCLWGFGFWEKYEHLPDVCLDVIQWFKDQGCYVIGGVPTSWRYDNEDSRPGYGQVYRSFDCVSPWMVGRIRNDGDADAFYGHHTIGDIAECRAVGIDYQPCVLPGGLNQRDRKHGDFMWRQFYNMINAGSPAVYISMFDEYNESNQIAKTAESLAFVPAGSTFLGLDEDGTPCTSDYYLRLTGDGGRMLKAQIALTATRPTLPWIDQVAGPFSVRSHGNGKFVGGVNVTADATGIKERYRIVKADADLVALQSTLTNKYVCAEAAGAEPLVANRDVASGWEMFALTRNAGGTANLRCNANGKFVSVKSATGQLVADSATVGLWETFDLF
jgi:hypothetical protein